MTGTALSGKKYKAYSEYKESGVEWLKEVPSSWFISDLRRGIDFLTDFEANGSFSDVKKNVDLDAEGKYAWYLRATDLQSGRLGFTLGNRTIDENAYRFLKKTTLYGGELLVAKRGEIGKVYLVPKLNCKATLAPNLYLIRLNERLNPKFSLYWFMSSLGKPQLELANKSTTIGALYKDDVRACQILYPTLEEQQKIASFLDHETAKIDTLITKQEKLIELLKEKRQAVISHAVTKGLNPNAPMRDSGVEWLGEVPEHWRKIAFKQIIKTRKGVAFSTSDFCDSGIRVVKASDIKQLSLNLSDVFLPKDFITKYPKAYLAQGNIILSTVGSTPDVRNSAVGQIAMVPQKLDKTLLNQNTVVFDPIGNAINRNYLFFVLQTRAYRDHLDLHAHGTANQASLNVADMLDFKCFIPLIDEQNQIAEYLKKLLRTVSGLETKAISAINLLKERKTALISAAVTGKIDVRDWESQGI